MVSVSSSSSNSSSTLSNRPTSSAPALSSITCADLIMRSRYRMRLRLRFCACLAALYSKFSLRSPNARVRLTSSISSGISSSLRWSSSFCIISMSCAVRSSCIAFHFLSCFHAHALDYMLFSGILQRLSSRQISAWSTSRVNRAECSTICTIFYFSAIFICCIVFYMIYCCYTPVHHKAGC